MQIPRRSGTILASLCAAGVCLAAAGCGSTATSAHTTSSVQAAGPNVRFPAGGVAAPTGGIHDRSGAAALACQLLARALLPPGTKPVSQAPAPVLAIPPQTPGASNLADETSFAVTPKMTMAEVIAYVGDHHPRGWQAAGSGRGRTSDHGVVTEEFVSDALGGMPSGIDSAILLVSVAPLPANSEYAPGAAVRVDAQVVWLPVKPAGATVPARDHEATVSIVELMPTAVWRREKLPAPREVTVTNPVTVTRLGAAADGLPVALPGTRTCPADLGVRYVVAFAPGPGRTANRTYTAGSCDLVVVTSGERTIAILSDDATFDAAYAAVLGLKTSA